VRLNADNFTIKYDGGKKPTTQQKKQPSFECHFVLAWWLLEKQLLQKPFPQTIKIGPVRKRPKLQANTKGI
jgi:hypothetical protein